MKRKTEMLSDILGDIDDELLYQTQLIRSKKPLFRKKSYIRWAAVLVAAVTVCLLIAKLPPLGGSLNGTVTDFSSADGWIFVDDGHPLTGVQENIPGFEGFRFTFNDDGVLITVEKQTENGWQSVWQSSVSNETSP